MDVAIHHVGFPYLRIKLQPNLRMPLGRNTAEVLRNVEHVYKLKRVVCLWNLRSCCCLQPYRLIFSLFNLLPGPNLQENKGE